MYLTYLKTVCTEAMKSTFDAEYPADDFKNLKVSIEFPKAVEDYPSIWVTYAPNGALQPAGINHHEEGDPHDAGGPAKRFQRWRFQGTVSFTGVALTSLERDRLHDEMVRVLVFGQENPAMATFRSYIENNEFLAMNANFDEIEQEGSAETPTTPWGTDEMIYETTVGIVVIGEFVSDGTGEMVPLREIRVYPYTDREPDPTTPGGWL